MTRPAHDSRPCSAPTPTPSTRARDLDWRARAGARGGRPNRFIWWDPRYKQKLPGPEYAYPRFSTHALVEAQRLATALMESARQAPPRAAEVWIVSNAADMAVSNAASAELVRRWRAA